jgi:hypothetical protein
MPAATVAMAAPDIFLTVFIGRFLYPFSDLLVWVSTLARFFLVNYSGMATLAQHFTICKQVFGKTRAHVDLFQDPGFKS